MSSFIDRMLGRNPKGSSATAKERLQIVLVHDRINLPPERLKTMKEEILAVISKYVPVDVESVDISLEQRDRTSSRIRAEIPFNTTVRMIDPDEDVDDTVTARNASLKDSPAPASASSAPAPKDPSFLSDKSKDSES
ncbi:MAG: cell division topological specificity factor MinE [Anaerolineae bacterium]|nr:cell division topological specificity factor MinE [Anaerolineae bacterium]MDW8171221.1 cell division topological specificity factor MinE [Anaerolineae bacterium]